MPFINIEVWDASASRKNNVEVPNDVPINRIIVLLVDKLNYPKYDSTGGQILSYKLHHQRTKRQLPENQTFSESGVENGDILTIITEIIAG